MEINHCQLLGNSHSTVLHNWVAMQLSMLQLGCHAAAGCSSELHYDTTGLPCSCSNCSWVAMQLMVAQANYTTVQLSCHVVVQTTAGFPCSCWLFKWFLLKNIQLGCHAVVRATAELPCSCWLLKWFNTLKNYNWVAMQLFKLPRGCHAAGGCSSDFNTKYNWVAMQLFELQQGYHEAIGCWCKFTLKTIPLDNHAVAYATAGLPCSHQLTRAELPYNFGLATYH